MRGHDCDAAQMRWRWNGRLIIWSQTAAAEDDCLSDPASDVVRRTDGQLIANFAAVGFVARGLPSQNALVERTARAIGKAGCIDRPSDGGSDRQRTSEKPDRIVVQGGIDQTLEVVHRLIGRLDQ